MSDVQNYLSDNQDQHSNSSAGLNDSTANATPARTERRSRRRALISAPVRVRSLGITNGGPDEISTTLDVSRNGLLFVSSLCTFVPGMDVAVTFPYHKSHMEPQSERSGRVTRVSEAPGGNWSVAVTLVVASTDELVDSSGRKLNETPDSAHAPEAKDVKTEKTLVMIVDADPSIRESVKSALTCEGYEVVALAAALEAREVLKTRTPALVIAEIEGEGLPGYDLCAYVKATPRLRAVPVVLLTSSAYPSDYSSAHSLGAVVCMAKPYRQDRFAHVVRLLAPTAQAKALPAPPQPVGLKRKPCSTPYMGNGSGIITNAVSSGANASASGANSKSSPSARASIRSRFRTKW
jgi:twitching motility two-component system response regulator PilG